MKKFLVISVLLALVLALDSNTLADENQNLFTLDEQVWVLFYDVPSRRVPQVWRGGVIALAPSGLSYVGQLCWPGSVLFRLWRRESIYSRRHACLETSTGPT
jgi:hypothetical protein